MVRLFLRLNWQAFARYVRRDPVARLVTVGAFAAVLALLAAGIFAFFRGGLQFVTETDFFAEALPLYLYEIFFLAIMYLVVASSLIAGIFQFFRKGRDDWIVISPSFAALPRYMMVRTLIATVLPFLVIALPALFAMSAVFGTSAAHFVIALVAITMFLKFLVVISVALIFLLGSLLRRLSMRVSADAVALGAVVIFALLTVFIWGRVETINLAQLFDVQNVEAVRADVAGINERFSLLPSHLPASVLAAAQAGDTSAELAPFGILAVLLAAAYALFRIAARDFLPIWQETQEGALAAHVRTRHAALPRPFPRMLGGPRGALFEKEFITLLRSSRELMWLGFLFALWLAQTGLDFLIRDEMMRERFQESSIPAIIQAAQVVLIVYFIAAFVLRFVLPAFSTERDTAWILLSSPLPLGRVFWAKLFFYCTIFGVLALVISLIHASILEMTILTSVPFLLVALTAALSVTAFGLSIGAMVPNFESTDPEVLSTSLPGLAFIVGSLAYGAGGAYAIFLYLSTGSLAGVFVFELLSLAAVFVLGRAALRRIGRVEFSPSAR